MIAVSLEMSDEPTLVMREPLEANPYTVNDISMTPLQHLFRSIKDRTIGSVGHCE